VVGWIPLADPEASAKALDALKPRKKFVGMRHLIVYEKDPRWLLQPAVQESLVEFARRGFAFEAITNTEEQLGTVLDTARRMPNLNIVLNHLGRPPLPEKGWEPWASQMVKAAAFPNISAKLSVGGDVVWRWKWSTEEIRRYSGHVIQHFGPQRVMAGSNWPVVLLSGSFAEVWHGIENLLTGLSASERAAVLGGTAERVYRI
jgi:L-fuconolactonase